MIDELSKTMTTAQVIRHYTKSGFAGHLSLQSDLLECSEGNRRAIQAALGLEVKQYDQGEFMDMAPEEEMLRGGIS